MMNRLITVVAASVLFLTRAGIGEETHPAALQEAGVRYQVTGLFCEDRVHDLELVFETLPDIKLKKIDFDNAEITVEYDRAKVFPDAKSEEQLIQRFDNLVRHASNHTFGIKPLSAVPKDRLTLVEILIVGLDCKACSLGAYEAIYRIKGVERATASFKEGRVTAMIDPEQTNRDELEKALRQRGVRIRGAKGEVEE